LTIFGKKLAFFSKTNVMVIVLHNLALYLVKDANFFAKFFGENILKIITSVPGHLESDGKSKAALPQPYSINRFASNIVLK
jgi:hypothetical protein